MSEKKSLVLRNIPKKNPESNRMTWNINKQSHNKEKLSGKS